MGLFSFLKGKKGQPATDGAGRYADADPVREYVKALSEEGYATLVQLFCEKLAENGYDVAEVRGGRVAVKNPRDENQQFNYFHLDNLVRKAAENARENWDDMLTHHVGGMRLAEEYSKNRTWSAVKDEVVLTMYPHGAIPDAMLGQLFYREDMPGIYTMVGQDTPQAIGLLNREQEGANTYPPDEDLFALALDNTLGAPHKMDREEVIEGVPIYFIWQDICAPALILEPARILPEALARFGMVVAVPTKDIVAVLPIHGLFSLQGLNVLGQMTYDFYNTKPRALSSNLYWWHDGEFRLFEARATENGQGVGLVIPLELLQMLGEAGELPPPSLDN